jgi:heme/copper-type cytochrome/quinol oxidase subunit 4/cytochrome c2
MHMEGAPQHVPSHRGTYLVIAGLSILLTMVAFGLVLAVAHPPRYAVPVILVLAAIQVAMQVVLFMHLKQGRRMYSIFFGYGVFLALVVAIGLGVVMASAMPGPPVVKLTPAQLVAEGGSIVQNQCEACHMVNGAGHRVGPDLNQVMEGKVNLVPGGQPQSSAWLARWIADPQGVWSAATMPNLGLTNQQVQAVVLYLKERVK